MRIKNLKLKKRDIFMFFSCNFEQFNFSNAFDTFFFRKKKSLSIRYLANLKKNVI